METNFAIGVAPNKADWQAAPEFAARGLVANTAIQTCAQYVKFGLAHGALQTQQESIVEMPRMVDAIRIADQRIADAGKIDETMPVSVIACEARHFKTEHDADMAERHLSGDTSKPRADSGAGTRKAKILVDDSDPIIGPAEFAGLERECILPVR